MDSKSIAVTVELALGHLMRLLYFNKGLVFSLHSLAAVGLFRLLSASSQAMRTSSSVSCDWDRSKWLFHIRCNFFFSQRQLTVWKRVAHLILTLRTFLLTDESPFHWFNEARVERTPFSLFFVNLTCLKMLKQRANCVGKFVLIFFPCAY